MEDKLKASILLRARVYEAYSEPNDFLYDEISEAIKCYCDDAYTRGYLMRKLEVDSEHMKPKLLWQSMYYFVCKHVV